MAFEKLSSKPDGFQRRGQAWFCTTGLPSDIIIEVEEMSFHLHKFPLMSRCGKLSRLIPETPDDDEEGSCRITLLDLPGGADAFELAAKFCYGVKLEFTPFNLTPLRCAAEYLEMTEEFGEGNLISKTDDFLNHVVLRSWKDSVQTLQSCESLMPLAEELNIVKKCVDSIAMKACTDPRLFGWPMTEGAGTQGIQSPGGNVLWNGINTGQRPRTAGSDWWYEDIAVLSLNFYKRVISAMEEKEIRQESITGAVMYYAKKFIPGLTRRGIATSINVNSAPSEVDQREFLETIESLLPESRVGNTTNFLFGLLRTANILDASDSCKINLERRIGLQLEQATLDDLLMPSYSYTVETLYDIDCVQRILQYFLSSHHGTESAVANPHGYEDGGFMGSPSLTPIMIVGKLIDGYLAEVAPDGNLKPTKFQMLAEALPDYARVFDDGLYRAIDVYLKAHPWVTLEEREKICSIMDCQKLTLEACTHAAQNERLPLRVVVQVLFFEQLQLRNAIAGSFLAADGADPAHTSHLNPITDLALSSTIVGGDRWNNTIRENQVLKMDIDTMRSRVHELERVCSHMRHAIEQIDKPKVGNSKTTGSSWNFMSKKFGCKFRMQVCDSQQRKVMDGRSRDRSNTDAGRSARHRDSSSLG
ncbi:BTB/POZ domain-containing protein At1g30440 [Cryptomeria japonica]|uniref:BTB/POZ domain-containing protein At1g30440 n=1 Tax=Cryptomeria japonica TaxID=3369 RepID=UPI0025AC385A|nr:BTB/POZ domain-containing protein At1g30440 [Cryptomeria japonica]XP_057873793.1 BTB/POZ domain-containing protein At1g30440 [Cryptomeria japonica]XP_057873794.1 BTB/POZ domain-containing protein At1g30440 [Cryptomeria japonica]XP_057873796.1 BTB/POZ domain-containing protein At1g30440 [Cryptomeria japonica]XP_057873797.1 BTB/POZ domain-containing protein At1g30440 [Cryptomeria japonica]XP_059063321.1 BTB/POZ domain-containing protein At1g30440 [Cryptomeria japonica]